MQKIEILKDTLIEDNTADSLRVVFTDEKPVTEYVGLDGTKVKGDNLTISTISTTTQGDLKKRLGDIDTQINDLTSERRQIQETLDLVIPEIDKAISEIIATEGSKDNRKKQLPI